MGADMSIGRNVPIADVAAHGSNLAHCDLKVTRSTGKAVMMGIMV